MDALVDLQEQALALAGSLSEQEWEAPSDCAGWRVRDVFAHLGHTFHGVCDPSLMGGGDTPEAAEAALGKSVDERRDWTIDQVLDEYRTYAPQVLELLRSMQEPPLADSELSLGALGTHPMHRLANAFVFDHYCHLRDDVLAPYGSVERPAPEPSESYLAPTMEWLMGGLPQMCAPALGIVDRPVTFHFTGAGGGTWSLVPAGDGTTRVVEGGVADAAAEVTSGTDEFVRWGTKRRDWRDEGVSITGDEAYAAGVLDAIRAF